MRRLCSIGILSVLVLSGTACSNGSGGELPFAGPPNNSGGSTGQNQPGGNTTALIRYVQGSPDYANVDVCIDNLPFGVTAPLVSYGAATANLYAIVGGVSHTVAVYPFTNTLFGGGPGVECPTAPGPYLGTSPINVITIAPGTPGNPLRETIVLGGTAASGTLGQYVFGDPSFPTAPTGLEAISHNAAPAFSKAAVTHAVGFGTSPPPTTLPGAQALAAPAVSMTRTAVINATVTSPLAAVPASFYDGTGVVAGTVVPITSVPAPPASSPYVVALYAIDAPAGGLNLIAIPEQDLTSGI